MSRKEKEERKERGRKGGEGAEPEMAKGRSLPCKPGDLRQIPGAHIKVEGGTNSAQ